jgi:hypothetical protein
VGKTTFYSDGGNRRHILSLNRSVKISAGVVVDHSCHIAAADRLKLDKALLIIFGQIIEFL